MSNNAPGTSQPSLHLAITASALPGVVGNEVLIQYSATNMSHRKFSS